MAHHMKNVSSQAQTRYNNDRAVIENPLSHLTDEELQVDVKRFVDDFLPTVQYDAVLRAARVARDIRLYDEVSRVNSQHVYRHLPVQLTDEEKIALRREKDVPFSERGMRIVILTVSLAALLQGFVQSSFNGATLYMTYWASRADQEDATSGSKEWIVGAVNACPWFFAAFVGCPLSLPLNYWYGRRGALAISAFLIFASCLGAAWADTWQKLLGVRVLNGIGMGIKAVSTPILASETAVGFWRGTNVVNWQLWVAFGIMLSFGFNLIFSRAPDEYNAYQYTNAAPFVPALLLFAVVVLLCPESPRYHLLKGPNYSPQKAYQILRRLRNTELQALRDMYTVHKCIEQEYMGDVITNFHVGLSPGFWWAMRDFFRQWKQLFQQRRLYNALMSTSTVSLAQQLCGVNVLAFYSGTLFNNAGADKTISMVYSLAFGAINFLFCLPVALRGSLDTLGRRKWLLFTIPVMFLSMLGGSFSFLIDGGNDSSDTRTGVVAFFLFLFAIAYSPAMGPIPFLLASESFPLTHREAGTAWAIAINLGAAGFLSLLYPRIASGVGDSGSLALFAAFNVIAFILVFLLVEETKRRSLEDLDLIFAVSKRRFMSFNIKEYGPWCIRRYLFRQRDEFEPELYHDMIWGPMVTRELELPPIGCDDEEQPWSPGSMRQYSPFELGTYHLEDPNRPSQQQPGYGYQNTRNYY